MRFRRNAFFSAMIFFAFSANAEIFFTGETGFRSAFSKKSDTLKDSGISFQGFVAGQFGITKNLFARGEISVKTSDISSGLFQDTDSLLSLNELSLIFATSTGKTSHFFSAFIGNADPIGKDSFFRHNFGIKTVSSPLTENYTGSEGIMLYPLRGIGGSYTARFSALPIAFAAYIYKNDEAADSESSIKAMPNFDLRAAIAMEKFIFDFAAGLGIPFEDNEDTDAFLYIKEVFMHTGFSVLFGNEKSSSLFLQAGFRDAKISSSFHKPSFSEITLFLEPRFRFKNGGLNFSIFNLPTWQIYDGTNTFCYNKFTYLDNTLGLNIMAYNDALVIRNTKIKIGLNFMFSFAPSSAGESHYINDIKDFSDLLDDKEIKIAPFLQTEILDGIFNTSLQFKIIGKPKFRGIIGYKKTL